MDDIIYYKTYFHIVIKKLKNFEILNKKIFKLCDNTLLSFML